jgi:hypothetical protein
MGSSSQTPVTQQTTQNRDPWAPAQPFLQQAMNNAQQLYENQGGYQPFTGNTVAGLDPNTLLGMSDIANTAQAEPLGSTNLANARSFTNDLVQNQGLNTGLQTAANQYGDIYNSALGDQNPYLQGVINQQMDKANSAMSGAGRYGSGSHDAAIAQAVAPTLAADYARRQQLQMGATGAQADIYSGGLQRAGQAAQLTPGLDQARFANAGNLLGIGDVNRGYQQQLLDQQVKLYNAQQAYPWEQLARYNAISGQAGGLGGTSVTTAPGATQPSTLQRILGGGIAGAGLGGSFGGPVGAGVGAASGGLLGLLG